MATPAKELAVTYEFLGLDTDYMPANLRAEVNRTVEEKARLSSDVLGRLAEIVQPDISELAAMVPNLDLSLWPSAGR